MRACPSAPEALLWQALVNRKLDVSFRRQVPLAGFICDFVCAERRLVVEARGQVEQFDVNPLIAAVCEVDEL